ncbi:hypothetical protein GQX74_012141, partial [Glossina fuscipes]
MKIFYYIVKKVAEFAKRVSGINHRKKIPGFHLDRDTYKDQRPLANRPVWRRNQDTYLFLYWQSEIVCSYVYKEPDISPNNRNLYLILGSQISLCCKCFIGRINLRTSKISKTTVYKDDW